MLIGLKRMFSNKDNENKGYAGKELDIAEMRQRFTRLSSRQKKELFLHCGWTSQSIYKLLNHDHEKRTKNPTPEKLQKFCNFINFDYQRALFAFNQTAYQGGENV